MTKRLLVIGERSREGTGPSWADLPVENPFRWLLNSRALGALCSSRSAATLAGKLCSVGVDLGDKRNVDSLNLLPPDPRPGAWDAALARSVAEELRTRLFAAWCPVEELKEYGIADLDWGRANWQRGTWRYSGVVLCGRRVAEAMDYNGAFWSSDGGTLLVPHPSGLSREWNGLDVGSARGEVERWIETLPEV